MVLARRREIHQRDKVACTSASTICGRGRGHTSQLMLTLSARLRGRGILFSAGNSRIARTGRALMSQDNYPSPLARITTLTQAPASSPQQQDKMMDDIENSEPGVDMGVGDHNENDFGSRHSIGKCRKCYHPMDSTHVKQIIILLLTIHPRRPHRPP